MRGSWRVFKSESERFYLEVTLQTTSFEQVPGAHSFPNVYMFSGLHVDAERQKSNHEFTIGTQGEERPTERWQQPRTTGDDEETKHKASRRGMKSPAPTISVTEMYRSGSDGAA